MRRTIRRASAAVGVAGLLLSLSMVPALLAYAQSAEGPQTAEGVLMGDEAWFYRHRQPLEPAPSPEDPTGNEIPAIIRAETRNRTNFYNAARPETLHVGVHVGEPEAVTFVGLPLIELGGGLPPVVTGGEIILTDAGSDHGSLYNETELVACLATEFWVSGMGGDWGDLPPYDCATRSNAVLVEGSDPAQWQIDLAPFTSVWADPAQNFGVAVVPDPDSEESPPEQTWRVAFHGQRYEPEEGAEHHPIVANLTYVEQQLPDFSFEDPAIPDQSDFGSADTGSASGFDGGGSSNGPGGGFDAGTVPDSTAGEDVPDDVGEPVFDEADDPQAAAPLDEEPTGIRTNPMVYLLPFLGLGLAGLLGYSLSHEPQLPSQREGAVSRLMRRRRAGMR